MYQLLKRELAAGTPINGVGFKMHLHSDCNDFDGAERNLQRFADLGLDICITELDVALDLPANQQTQAEVYSRLEVCLAQLRCESTTFEGACSSCRHASVSLHEDSVDEVHAAVGAHIVRVRCRGLFFYRTICYPADHRFQ